MINLKGMNTNLKEENITKKLRASKILKNNKNINPLGAMIQMSIILLQLHQKVINVLVMLIA